MPLITIYECIRKLRGKLLNSLLCGKAFTQTVHSLAFHHFHTNHNASCLPPKFCITDCFQFLLGITPVPREIKDKGYAKCRKVHKVCYRLCENGE